MTRANEVPVVSTVLSLYNRLVTYRPHLTEESRRNLVQKKLLEDYQTKASLEQIALIIKSHPEIIPVRKPVLVKRDTNQEGWRKKASPIERKRDFRKISDENFSTIQSSTTDRFIEDSKLPFNFEFTGKNNPQSKSKIPRPIFRFGKYDIDNKQHSNIYDRLYQQRQLPCEHQVERVHFIRDIWISKTPQQKQPQRCASHEPPEKRYRYSKQGALGTSVFDRLYAQRKQLNTKKLTDVQERQLYLRKQKKEHLKMQRKRVESLSAQKCGSLPSSTASASSTTSEESVSAQEEFSDVSAISLNDSSVFNSTMKPGRADGNDEIECSFQSMHSMLDNLTLNFNSNMTLCHLSEHELSE